MSLPRAPRRESHVALAAIFFALWAGGAGAQQTPLPEFGAQAQLRDAQAAVDTELISPLNEANALRHMFSRARPVDRTASATLLTTLSQDAGGRGFVLFDLRRAGLDPDEAPEGCVYPAERAVYLFHGDKPLALPAAQHPLLGGEPPADAQDSGRCKDAAPSSTEADAPRPST